MNEINTANLLSQLRLNALLAQNKGAASVEQSGASQGADFSALLKQSIDKVNSLQQDASKLGVSFELGDPNVSLAQVMLAKQKAGIAFQAVVQVRNKLVDAYKEVMSMHV